MIKHVEEKYNNFFRPHRSARYPLKRADNIAPSGTTDTITETSQVESLKKFFMNRIAPDMIPAS